MTADIAILVSSFERPWHLHRVLHSIAVQEDVEGRFEIVVTDDGSRDQTVEVVGEFARQVSFPVRYTTHDHQDFQLARCRNEGVAASTAPYLLFIDGDCLLPSDHVWRHLDRRREGTVWSGFCYRLEKAISEQMGVAAIRRGDFLSAASRPEVRKLRLLAAKSWFYSAIRHRTKPRLFGGNVGIHRSDYELVNGYDENFEGWGGEDDDLCLRLRQAGVEVRSILPWTRTYHLWHEPVESAPRTTREGRNIEYLNRRQRPTRCVNGLVHHSEPPIRRAA